MSLPITRPSNTLSDRRILRNLISQEWCLCGGSVMTLAMAWLIGLWLLVIFSHPGWLVAIGLWHCVTITPAQAGHDVLDGTEEFSFSQPPGRAPLYLARLAPGLVFLLANGVLGGLAIACNLPQRLWAVVFSGGLTVPFAPVAGGLWYAMAILLPGAAHAVTFTLAANASSRPAVNASWLSGCAASVSVMLAGFYLENLLWHEFNGFIAGPALLLTTVLTLIAGHWFYRRKEASGSGGVAAKTGSAPGFWLIAVLIGLVLLLMMMFGGATVRAGADGDHRVQRAKAQQLRAQAEQPSPVPAAGQTSK